MRVERQRSILLTPAVEDYTWMLANRDMRTSLQSFGDFQADSLKETGQAGECQVNETFERIESTAQYCGFSLSHFAAIGDGKKNWKSSLTIRGDISTYRRENGQS